MTFADIQQSVSGIRNLSGAKHGRWLFDLAMQTTPEAFLCEIGTYFGYLATVLAKTGRQVIVIDHMLCGFCDIAPGTHCPYLEVIQTWKQQGVWDRIVPMPLKSADAMPMMRLLNPRIELLYLDGDHNEEPVFKELTDYSPFVPVGGFICGDDCLPATGSREPFPVLWGRNDVNAFYQEGVSLAVWRFFHDNDSFEVLPNPPLNQFGFRRIK